jgi:hypothetical protein
MVAGEMDRAGDEGIEEGEILLVFPSDIVIEGMLRD